MSSKRQTGRPAWRDSSSRKVSVVEAASIVESFLIEQNLVRTLTELRGEAASLLSKGKRGQVKSLNKILHDYLVVMEERNTLKQANANLEQALKAEKLVNAQGHDSMRILCRRIHESIAQYEGGPMLPLGNLLPPLGNPLPHLQPMPPFFFGHSTPPAAGVGPMLATTPGAGILPASANTPGAGILPAVSSTPGAGILPPAASTLGTGNLPPAANIPVPVTAQVSAEQKNKRTIHSIPSNSGQTVAAAPKKARQNSTPAEKTPSDAPASPPWAMCGSVRKTSLNSVRTVPSKPSTVPVARSSRKGSKKQKQQQQQMPPTLSHSIRPQEHAPPPITSSSPLLKAKSLPSGLTSSAAAHIDLSSPAKASEGQSASHSDCKALQSKSAPPTSKKPLAPPHRQLSEGSRTRGGEDSTKEMTHCSETEEILPHQITGGFQQDRTSPDSRRCGFGARGMKPSKTMRPLNFSSGEENPDEATLPLACAPPTAPSPSPSSNGIPALDPGTPNDTESRASSLSGSQETISPDASSMSALGHDLFLEDDEQLCGDLAPIDDILAILDETSFSDIYSHSFTAGDCGHLHTDQTNSQIGEDSFGFHGLLSKIDYQQPERAEDEIPNVLTSMSVNFVDDVASERKPNSPTSKRATIGAAMEAEKSRSTSDKENILVCTV